MAEVNKDKNSATAGSGAVGNIKAEDIINKYVQDKIAAAGTGIKVEPWQKIKNYIPAQEKDREEIDKIYDILYNFGLYDQSYREQLILLEENKNHTELLNYNQDIKSLIIKIPGLEEKVINVNNAFANLNGFDEAICIVEGKNTELRIRGNAIATKYLDRTPANTNYFIEVCENGNNELKMSVYFDGSLVAYATGKQKRSLNEILEAKPELKNLNNEDFEGPIYVFSAQAGNKINSVHTTNVFNIDNSLNSFFNANPKQLKIKRAIQSPFEVNYEQAKDIEEKHTMENRPFIRVLMEDFGNDVAELFKKNKACGNITPKVINNYCTEPVNLKGLAAGRALTKKGVYIKEYYEEDVNNNTQDRHILIVNVNPVDGINNEIFDINMNTKQIRYENQKFEYDITTQCLNKVWSSRECDYNSFEEQIVGAEFGEGVQKYDVNIPYESIYFKKGNLIRAKKLEDGKVEITRNFENMLLNADGSGKYKKEVVEVSNLDMNKIGKIKLVSIIDRAQTQANKS